MRTKILTIASIHLHTPLVPCHFATPTHSPDSCVYHSLAFFYHVLLLYIFLKDICCFNFLIFVLAIFNFIERVLSWMQSYYFSPNPYYIAKASVVVMRMRVYLPKGPAPVLVTHCWTAPRPHFLLLPGTLLPASDCMWQGHHGSLIPERHRAPLTADLAGGSLGDLANSPLDLSAV